MTARGMSARLAAYRCLEAVEESDAYANLALPSILREAGLAGRDAAFATELAYGAIRMRALYDAAIASAARREPSAIDPPVLRTLRLTAHQALAMRVPPHAVVSETVALVREVGRPGVAGFANAVARRLTEASRDQWVERLAPGDGLDAVALRQSHPRWMVEALDQALRADGREGELEDLLASHNAPAHVTLAARPGLVDRDELVASISASRPTPLSPVGVALSGGDPSAIEAVRDGRAGVQDEGSQVVALALVEGAGRGESWQDACAGPGGKASLLGAVAATLGGSLEAIDIHPHRAALVETAVRALPPRVVTVRAGDARETGGAFDRVLLDAPCTGLGALRRRPEARWRRTEGDLADLATLQREILAAGLARLKPGGVLAYVTCSPVLNETRIAVDDVLAMPVAAGVERLDAREAMAGVTGRSVSEWGRGPDVQMWTHAHGTDSMFLALLRSPLG